MPDYKAWIKDDELRRRTIRELLREAPGLFCISKQAACLGKVKTRERPGYAADGWAEKTDE